MEDAKSVSAGANGTSPPFKMLVAMPGMVVNFQNNTFCKSRSRLKKPYSWERLGIVTVSH